jgi:glutathione S-transferase
MNGLVLVIGNKNYSSWSMRPWVLMRERSIEFDEIQIPLRQSDSLDRKLGYSPAGKVPVLLNGERQIWESIAIVEYLAEKYPDAHLWPKEEGARAVARAVSSEMHAGFESLRSQMFFNCRMRFPGKGRGPGVQEEIDRILALWRDCRRRHGRGGDFLFGEFTIADAMFTPVVLRFQTYVVELEGVCREYADAVLALPPVQDWLEAAGKEPWTIPEFEY